MQTPTHSSPRSSLSGARSRCSCARRLTFLCTVGQRLADSDPGALYTQTNNRDNNQVVVYARGGGRSITEVQRIATGGSRPLGPTWKELTVFGRPLDGETELPVVRQIDGTRGRVTRSCGGASRLW